MDDVEGAVMDEHVCNLKECVIRDYYADLRLARTVGFCLGMVGHAVTVGVLARFAAETSPRWARAALGDS